MRAHSWTEPLLATVAGRLGLALTTAVLLVSVVGPWMTAYHPDAIDLMVRLQPPSPAHWFGTDELGRDLFARVAYGGRYSLIAALGVTSASTISGLIVGGMLVLLPAWSDAASMRVVDVVLSIPALVLAIALASALGPSLLDAMIALVVARIPAFIRLARSQALVVRSQHFVEAAYLYGGSRSYILLRHVLPNILPVTLVQGVSDASGVMLATAALGFVGLGAQPPTPEWGALVASGRLFFLNSWWYAFFPGAAILAAAMGLNLLGDVLRDVLDPRAQTAGGAGE